MGQERGATMSWSIETKQMLDEAKANLRAGKVEWVKATVEAFEHMLNVLPPAAYVPGGFATGEPYSDNAKGVPVFLCFRGQTGAWPTDADNLQACYMTLAEFRSQS
jgi:hypothetical protein